LVDAVIEDVSLGNFLLGGHALAALFHHYVKKDNTLLSMPFLKK